MKFTALALIALLTQGSGQIQKPYTEKQAQIHRCNELYHAIDYEQNRIQPTEWILSFESPYAEEERKKELAQNEFEYKQLKCHETCEKYGKIFCKR